MSSPKWTHMGRHPKSVDTTGLTTPTSTPHSTLLLTYSRFTDLVITSALVRIYLPLLHGFHVAWRIARFLHNLTVSCNVTLFVA